MGAQSRDAVRFVVSAVTASAGGRRRACLSRRPRCMIRGDRHSMTCTKKICQGRARRPPREPRCWLAVLLRRSLGASERPRAARWDARRHRAVFVVCHNSMTRAQSRQDRSRRSTRGSQELQQVCGSQFGLQLHRNVGERALAYLPQQLCFEARKHRIEIHDTRRRRSQVERVELRQHPACPPPPKSPMSGSSLSHSSSHNTTERIHTVHTHAHTETRTYRHRGTNTTESVQ